MSLSGLCPCRRRRKRKKDQDLEFRFRRASRSETKRVRRFPNRIISMLNRLNDKLNVLLGIDKGLSDVKLTYNFVVKSSEK